MHAAAIEHLRVRDQRLKAWIDRIGPIKLPPRRSRDPYRALLESVVYQQLHGSAARTIWNRLLDQFEDREPTPERVLATADDRLRGAGLSRNKATAIRAIAHSAAAGEIPDARRIVKLTDEEIRERLTRIRGIGPWTVDMLLIFTLRKPDIMPLNDYGVRKGFKAAYRKKLLPTGRQLLEFAERWRPYRTTAALYLWRIADRAEDDATS